VTQIFDVTQTFECLKLTTLNLGHYSLLEINDIARIGPNLQPLCVCVCVCVCVRQTMPQPPPEAVVIEVMQS